MIKIILKNIIFFGSKNATKKGNDKKMVQKPEEKLTKKFIEISKKGWIKGVNNSTNSVGLTFEKLLDKNPDSMYLPDYDGIEIKCSQRFSRYPISLFSLSFDGPELYEMNRLLKTYGIIDEKYNQRYQLQGFISSTEYRKINNNYFKLKIDKENKKILIGVYDLNYQIIEEKTYIEFDTIKTRLELKLSKLAVVYASKKTIDYNAYFRYYKIAIYSLKSFDIFLELLEKNYIKTALVGRVSRSGLEEGRQRNRNIVFSIQKENIKLLFTKLNEEINV